MNRFFAVVSLAIAVGLFCSPVLAQGEPSAAEIAVARKLFSEASSLESKKEWAAAEGKLREALKIKETPGLHYHLGYCLEQQAKLVDALVEYDRASEMLEQGIKAPDVAELVGPARDGVKKRVASVTLKVSDEVEDETIEIDGVSVKRALVGKAIPVNPGHRVIGVSAPGRQAFRRELDLTEGELREIEVTLPRLGNTKGGPTKGVEDDQPAEGASGSASSSGIPARTWVLLGEGAFTALAIGGAVLFTLDKNHAADQADAAQAEVDRKSGNSSSACPDKGNVIGVENDCGQLKDFTDQKDRSKTFATLSFVGAGVGAAAFLTTLFVWKTSSSKSEARVPPHVAPNVNLGPRQAFVGVHGSF